MNEVGSVFISAEDGELHGTAEQKKEQLDQLIDFGMEYYYDSIYNFTFKTRFIKITRQQAQVMIAHFIDNMTVDLLPIFKDLIKKIDSAISDLRKEIKDPKAKIFAKLSSRSPKDATQHLEKQIIPIIKKNFQKVPKNDLNLKMWALRQSFLQASQVSSANELLNLFSYSNRIISDLRIFLNSFPDDEKWPNISIVIRQFSNDLDVANEFRAFVKNGKVTALSQYQQELCMPEIVNNHDKISKKVQDFFYNQLVNAIPQNFIQGCVLDLALIKDDVVVIEINPFCERTGPALFKWSEDHDVLYGIKPFEFRYLKEPIDHMELRLAPWYELLKKAGIK